ncbi:hypothetical protein M513_11841 [Trichuris suis]|uniref:Uncharacterized protein n=1 Tax=Trichuris suis TaxID=68888 RepID=A0A085LQP2_9BILA|nr:hypothetical protein M513_11841 [Trichuris suis]
MKLSSRNKGNLPWNILSYCVGQAMSKSIHLLRVRSIREAAYLFWACDKTNEQPQQDLKSRNRIQMVLFLLVLLVLGGLNKSNNFQLSRLLMDKHLNSNPSAIYIPLLIGLAERAEGALQTKGVRVLQQGESSLPDEVKAELRIYSAIEAMIDFLAVLYMYNLLVPAVHCHYLDKFSLTPSAHLIAESGKFALTLTEEVCSDERRAQPSMYRLPVTSKEVVLSGYKQCTLRRESTSLSDILLFPLDSSYLRLTSHTVTLRNHGRVQVPVVTL